MKKPIALIILGLCITKFFALTPYINKGELEEISLSQAMNELGLSEQEIKDINKEFYGVLEFNSYFPAVQEADYDSAVKIYKQTFEETDEILYRVMSYTEEPEPFAKGGIFQKGYYSNGQSKPNLIFAEFYEVYATVFGQRITSVRVNNNFMPIIKENKIAGIMIYGIERYNEKKSIVEDEGSSEILNHKAAVYWREDFLNEFGLELGKSKRVSSVIKNKKELLYSKYYKRETEWLKSDEYTNELIKHYPMNKDAIMQERTDYEFWSGLNGKLSNECYYFNPLGFLNHMDKVATKPEYNPYEDLHYSDVYYKKNSFVANIDLSTKIKDNPGFAPYSGDYAMISGFFNEDYAKYDNLSYKNTYTHFYHEGIDFSAIVYTPIKSLINAKVIAFGLQKNGLGQYSTYGRCVWLQNINGPGIYLLAHLSKFCDNISVGMTVKVGEVIAYTGRSGAKDGKFVEECWAPHLHLQMYLSSEDIDDFLDLIISGTGMDQIIYASKRKDTFVVNPFDYIEKRFLEK